MTTFRELRRQLSRDLTPHYPEERERQNIIFLLLSHYTGYDQTRLLLQNDASVPESICRKVSNSLLKLKANTPIQYIIGELWFHDLRIEVNTSVLIPRPETEELADLACQLPLPENGHILEIGTGSGCIALALKKCKPGMDVTASDISEKALQTAEKNAGLNNLQVNFVHWDIRESHVLEKKKFDLIISNPPYVPPGERKSMEARVLDYEPNEALFTPEHDPLFYYRIIAQKANQMGKPSTCLAFECHTDYAKDTAAMLQQAGWQFVEIKKDLSGKNRFVFATL